MIKEHHIWNVIRCTLNEESLLTIEVFRREVEDQLAGEKVWFLNLLHPSLRNDFIGLIILRGDEELGSKVQAGTRRTNSGRQHEMKIRIGRDEPG